MYDRGKGYWLLMEALFGKEYAFLASILSIILLFFLPIATTYRKWPLYRRIMGDKAKPYLSEADRKIIRKEKAAARHIRAMQKGRGHCGRLRTGVTLQEFQKRFQKKIKPEAPGFFGEMTKEGVFTLRYAAEPTYNVFLKRLTGHFTSENEVAYRISGIQAFVKQEEIRKRLEEKLLELCK